MYVIALPVLAWPEQLKYTAAMAKETVEERLRFVFRPDLPAVELLCADDTPRTWTVFNLAFSFALLRTWQGCVDYRRRRLDAGPGEVFCAEPGEVHTAAPGGTGVGSFRVLMVSAGAFEEQCRVEGLRGAVHFGRIVTKATPRLGGALRAMEAALESDATSLEVQSRLAGVAQAAIAEVMESLPRPATQLPARSSIQQLRDLLHSSEGSRVSLINFARNAGMSQFQLLRGFKRMYGLTPHAYELNIRVGRARTMLRQGYTAAQAAAANDFTDQSHFTRHFRRIFWGMTPGQFAR